METKISIRTEFAPHPGRAVFFQQMFLPVVFALAVFLGGCENRDASLQAELAGLREKIRKTEQERDQAAKDKAVAEQSLARGSLLPAATLKEGIDRALKSLEQTAAATFPGYRPAPIKAGRIIYLYESKEPYRSPVELSLVPISGSALTPELPKMVVEARAGLDGEWQVPGQAALRELQVAAVARSSATTDRRPQAEPAAPSQNRQEPQVGSVKVINWGDPPGGAVPRPAAGQAPPRSSQPSGNTPRATESYEIRFND